jgi:hypothetical protein
MGVHVPVAFRELPFSSLARPEMARTFSKVVKSRDLGILLGVINQRKRGSNWRDG